MFVGMDHVGIAVKNLDEAIHVYRDLLGFKLMGVHVLAERKIKIALISTGGETQIELVQPLDAESTVAKFLETRGEGIHHFAIRVEDIKAALANMKKNNITLIDEKPRIGAEGKKVAFVHPKSTKGVLLELVMK